MLDPLDLFFPALPAALEGLRVAHLTDFHIDRHRHRHKQMMQLLASTPIDIIALTGDYMDHPGDEAIAAKVMADLVAVMKPKLGVFGVLGNHDTAELRAMLRPLSMRWLENASIIAGDLPLEIAGLDQEFEVEPDTMLFLSQRQKHHSHKPHTKTAREHVFRLLLCHKPTYLPLAADMGMDLMLSGHTHGGQCRLPPHWVLKNSCDLPLNVSSGLLQHRQTQCVISRGVGETMLPIRFSCPAHIPLYTLRKGPLPRDPKDCHHIQNVRPW